MPSKVHEINTEARKVSEEARPWVELVARVGYAAKGLVYLGIGILALLAALGLGGRVTGPRGVLEELFNHRFGTIMIGGVGLGLFAYALWRFVQALLDPEHRGVKAKALLMRVGFFFNGIIHVGLAWAAFGMLIGSRKGFEEFEKYWTANLLSKPFGQWLVALVALIVALIGAFQIYGAWTAKFEKRWKTHKVRKETRDWARDISRVGLTARGLAFGIITWFLIRAAILSDPNEAGGLGQALQVLASQHYGPWLLGIMAIGLAAYGIFALFEARLHRVFGARRG